MELSRYNVEKINYENHVHHSMTNDIRLLASPLNKINIFSFGYHWINKEGLRIHLSTDPDLSKAYVKNKLYKIGMAPDSNHYNTGYVLCDFLENNANQDINKEFGFGHGLVISRKTENFCELFYFATTFGNIAINNWYLNHLKDLDMFINIFKEQAAFLIDCAKKSPIYYPASQDHTGHIRILTNQEKLEIQPTTIYSFNSQLHMPLSAREQDCLKGIICGKTAKLIARELGISPRTAEQHTENLKKKFNVHSKSELIRKAFLFNYFTIMK